MPELEKNCSLKFKMRTDETMVMESAELLRERLRQSQAQTDKMVAILGSFDHRLSSLDVAMRPTQVQTYAVRKAHENIEKTLEVAETILMHYDISHQVEAKILEGPHYDLSGFLIAVDELQKALHFFGHYGKSKSREDTIHDTQELLSKAMYKLEEEFKKLLAAHSKTAELEQLIDSLPSITRHLTGARKASSGLASMFHSSSKKTENGSKAIDVAPAALPTSLPIKVVPELYEIAKRMINGGRSQQCTKIYREIRASSLNQTLKKIGVEKFSKEDVQKLSWESLEGKIGTWIQCLHIAVKILYTTEWKICNQLFHQLDPYRECCFAEVTESSVNLLLSFGEATVKIKRSPEKLFVLLDMYAAMCNLLPEVQTIFGAKATAESRFAFEELMKRLGRTARNTFGEFAEAVEKDSTKATIHDGTVHPLTSYVINYVKFLFDYRTTLEQLFGEDEKGDELSSQIRHIMFVLQTNLDGKAKQYKDPALMHLFLMNNIHYMVKSVRRYEARELLGDDWIQRHRRLVQQHASGYQRTAWSKVLQHVSWQGLAQSGNFGSAYISSIVSRSHLKERFKNFNQCFEELYQRQIKWTVPDVELRESLRLAVAEVLLPAYRSFLKRFSAPIQSGKNPQKYIKYLPEDLEQKLSEFFEGVSKGDQKRSFQVPQK